MMKKMKKMAPRGLLTVCVLLSPALQANEPGKQSTDVTRTEQGQQDRTRTDTLRQDAQAWGLSEEEYARWQALMNGPRGIQSPGLDPLTTLGIESRSDAERRRMAEKWVRQESARTEKELAFQREVDAAWKRLYPDTLPVRLGNATGSAADKQGRLALFVRMDDCAPCDARLAAVMAENRPVDIYVLGTGGSDDRLRAWAKQKKIPVERVKRRNITLNHDGGRSLQYGRKRPVLNVA